ncbi:uncharacterized protein K02A2.6-like [Topomyia yanbarensis]|uniref:uncharacterized protein K02A2.6-like n=1 Tax=Topomyia yanbarensis TaxID=2498891 RepID=UPI00273C28F5|nr:uncharacterized protein K02A2.6-like [Topomyia yanbarensis]
MQQALDIFLLTYRSTPNRALPDQKSPSEVMFGRKIRTCLELLRPPTVRTPVAPSDDHTKPRFFSRNYSVYAKLYGRNGWKWAPGTIIEKIGDVMYNVWVDDRRMLRSHINQLRSRLLTRYLLTRYQSNLPIKPPLVSIRYRSTTCWVPGIYQINLLARQHCPLLRADLIYHLSPVPSIPC